MNWVYDQNRRNRIGTAAMVFGLFTTVVGLVIAVAFGNENIVSDGFLRDSFLNMPRWIPVTFGQLTAVAGSQFIIGGAFLVWVTGKEMTWTRAGVATFLTWYQLVLFYGIIPSEWLNLTQGPLGWTSQKVFLTVPKFLILNNEVEISFAVLKDAISGGYLTGTLAAGIVLAAKIQGFGKGQPSAPVEVDSPYGRPLSKATK